MFTPPLQRVCAKQRQHGVNWSLTLLLGLGFGCDSRTRYLREPDLPWEASKPGWLRQGLQKLALSVVRVGTFLPK